MIYTLSFVTEIYYKAHEYTVHTVWKGSRLWCHFDIFTSQNWRTKCCTAVFFMPQFTMLSFNVYLQSKAVNNTFLPTYHVMLSYWRLQGRHGYGDSGQSLINWRLYLKPSLKLSLYYTLKKKVKTMPGKCVFFLISCKQIGFMLGTWMCWWLDKRTGNCTNTTYLINMKRNNGDIQNFNCNWIIMITTSLGIDITLFHL